MVKVKNGNLLEVKEDLLVHQVNVDGVMGGGVARQLANRFKYLEQNYALYCNYKNNYYELLKGNVYFYISDKIIANIFSQFPNFETDYEAMRECLKKVKCFAKESQKSIAMPYRNRLRNSEWILGGSL